ncbi:MAG: hypothetical protein QXY79_01900 [Candidatus Methanomethylicia archaeon]
MILLIFEIAYNDKIIIAGEDIDNHTIEFFKNTKIRNAGNKSKRILLSMFFLKNKHNPKIKKMNVKMLRELNSIHKLIKIEKIVNLTELKKLEVKMKFIYPNSGAILELIVILVKTNIKIDKITISLLIFLLIKETKKGIRKIVIMCETNINPNNIVNRNWWKKDLLKYKIRKTNVVDKNIKIE